MEMLDFCAEHGVIPHEMITGEDTEAHDNIVDRARYRCHRHPRSPDRVSVRGTRKPWAEWSASPITYMPRSEIPASVVSPPVPVDWRCAWLTRDHVGPTCWTMGRLLLPSSNRSPVRPLRQQCTNDWGHFYQRGCCQWGYRTLVCCWSG